MSLPHNALVLVIDGAKQLFLRNHGDASRIDLRMEAHDEQDVPKDGDLKTDSPGLSGQSGGYGRPSMDETDFHQQAEDRWVVEAAEKLRMRALKNDFDALAIIAAAKGARGPSPETAQGGRKAHRPRTRQGNDQSPGRGYRGAARRRSRPTGLSESS